MPDPGTEEVSRGTAGQGGPGIEERVWEAELETQRVRSDHSFIRSFSKRVSNSSRVWALFHALQLQ